jgi:hypothetical protein
MKKIIACCLCLLITISLCACQAKESSEAIQPSSNQQTKTDIQENINSDTPIEVDSETIKIGYHIEYGSYDLKEGDKISCDLGWSNSDGNLYIAVGTEFGSFDNGLVTSGVGECSLEETIEIKKDGIYYIYIGSQNTDKADIEDVKGTIVISQN